MARSFRARMQLLMAQPEVFKTTLRSGFRWPWDLGTSAAELGEVNDAEVRLLDRGELAPGETAEVGIVPLFPERWAKLRVGDVIRASYVQCFAEATILEIVGAEEPRARPNP